jgi:argininosuccinate lyase
VSTTRPRLIFVESNTTGTGRLFVSTARRLGFEPLLIAEDVLRYPYVQEDCVEVVRQSCIENLDGLERFIRQLAAQCTIAGIYSSSEYFIETASELARRCQLPGPDPRAIHACRNKWTQREYLRRAGVGVPAFIRATTPQEAVDALTTIPAPVVLKPTVGSGSVGVRLCRDQAEVETHASRLLAIRTNERGTPVPAEILVEQYLTWPEYSAESLGGCLLGITRKHVGSEPYFVETGHDFPAPLSHPETGMVAETIDRALKAMGMCWGPAHTEFRFSSKGFAIMEINPRLAGGFIPELVRMSTGVDMIEETILMVTGQKRDVAHTRKVHASIRFVCAPQEGQVTGFTGLDEAAATHGVASVQMYKKVGDNVAIHHDFRDRIGHVLSCDENPCTAITAAEAALNRINVQIEA